MQAWPSRKLEEARRTNIAPLTLLAAILIALAILLGQAWAPFRSPSISEPSVSRLPAAIAPASPQGEGAFELVPLDGLPSNEVRSFAEDAHGFMWIATVGGLARWDGTTLLSINADASDGPRLPRFTVTDIEPDPRSGIWAASGQLVYVDPWLNSVELVDLPAERLALAPNNQLWVVTDESVHLVDLDSREPTEVARGNFVRSDGGYLQAVADDDGLLYVGTEWGIFITDQDGMTESVVVPGGVRGLALRSDGGVWASTGSGLWQAQLHTQPLRIDFDGRARAAGKFDPSDALVEIDESIIIGREAGGVEWFDTSSQTWGVRLGNDSADLPHSAIHVAYTASDGGMWVASPNAGIYRLSPKDEHVSTLSPVTTQAAPLRDLLLQNGYIWVATDGTGLYRYSPASDSWRRAQEISSTGIGAATPSTESITGLAEHESGLWVAGWDTGLTLVSTESNESTRVAPLLDAQVFDVVEGPDNTVWVSVWNSGVHVLDTNGRPLHKFGPELSEPIANDRALVVQPNATAVWVGGWDGLEHIDLEDGTTQRWSSDNGLLRGDVVFDLIVQDANTVWVATSAGLELLDPESAHPARHYGSPAGFPSPQASLIVRHPSRNALWVATNNGLALFDIDAEEVSRVFASDGRLTGAAFSRFGKVSLNDGTIFLSSSTGLVRIEPQAGSPQVLRRPALITAITIDGQPATPAELDSVNRGSSIEMSFATPEFDAASDLEYRYRLAGSGDWIETSDGQRSVTLADLRPGSYRFEVESRLPGTDFTPASRSNLQVEVLAPFWMNRMLIVVAAIALAIAVFALDSRRQDRVSQRTTELEVLVSERTEQVAASAEAARAANASKARFLSEISHELRSPLQAILGYTDLIQMKSVVDPKVRKWATQAHTAGGHLEYMIEDLLAVARRHDLDTDDAASFVSLTSILSGSLDMVRLNARDDISIKLDASGIDGFRYLVQEHPLMQLVVNLAENAARHCDTEVTVFAHRIATLENGQHRIRLAVADDGDGIPDELLPELFHPFRRGDDTVGSGLGLGLSICAQIAERLNSEVTVDTRPGGPTEFVILLDLTASTLEPTKVGAGFGRIVVIDDDPMVRDLLVRYLGNAGYEGIPFESPSRAIETFDSICPVAVVTDHMMPHMSGGEVATAIRGRDDGGVPVIAVTAVPETALTMTAYSAVLAKPLRSSDLEHALEEAIGQR